MLVLRDNFPLGANATVIASTLLTSLVVLSCGSAAHYPSEPNLTASITIQNQGEFPEAYCNVPYTGWRASNAPHLYVDVVADCSAKKPLLVGIAAPPESKMDMTPACPEKCNACQRTEALQNPFEWPSVCPTKCKDSQCEAISLRKNEPVRVRTPPFKLPNKDRAELRVVVQAICNDNSVARTTVSCVLRKP